MEKGYLHQIPHHHVTQIGEHPVQQQLRQQQQHRSPSNTKGQQQQELCYCRVHGTVGKAATNKTPKNDPNLTQRTMNFYSSQHTQGQQQLFIQPDTGHIFTQPPPANQLRHRHHHGSQFPQPQKANKVVFAPDFKSAPSSPVAQHHYHHHHQSAVNSRYQAAVLSAVAQANQAKKAGGSFLYHPDYSMTPTPVSTPLASEASISGCCGRELSLSKLKSKRGLSSSYSALDTVSTAESDGSVSAAAPNSQKKVSDCVKNLVQWMSKVGKESTTAFLEAMPSLKEDFHVVMIGLDSAGKSTVLYRLKFDQYVNTVPTIGFNCEKVRGTIGKTRNLTFLVWDVGGQEKIRPLWRPYTRGTDGIIFVVDSCDHERMEEAKLELHRIMRANDNSSTPLLVIANKQDLPSAKSPKDLESFLCLNDLRQLWHLEPVCAVTGEGLDVAIEHLHELIAKKKKLNKRARNKTR